LRRAQAEVEISRARYFDLYDLAPVGYFTLNEKGLILEANLTSAKLLAVERKALVKQPLPRFVLPEDQDIYYKHRKELFATGAPQVFELRITKKDGALIWVRFEATLAQEADGSPVCRAMMINITDKKNAEAEMQRTNRALLMLKECDEALVQAKSEADLLNEICRIIVETGGSLMAWVGYAENDAEKTVRPVTQMGGDKEYLKILNVTWADGPHGRGPVGTAIRTRKVNQCRDVAGDPPLCPLETGCDAARLSLANSPSADLGEPVSGGPRHLLSKNRGI